MKTHDTMKIPNKLKIAGHWYTVEFPYEFNERGDIKGQHDVEALKIRLSGKDSWDHTDRPESTIYASLLHEILHAVDTLSGHKVFQDNEPAINGISELLFQVFRDNKLYFGDIE